MARKWKAEAIAVEGVATGDGRVIAPGALRWESLPAPLGWLEQSQHGDGMGNPGAVDLGNIATLSRQGSNIAATGVIDDESDYGDRFCSKLDAGTAPMGDRWGVSVDLDDTVVEIIDTNPDAEDGIDIENTEVLLASFSGAAARSLWRSGASPGSLWRALSAAAGDTIPGGVAVVSPAIEDTVKMRLVSGRIRGATCCAIPAFDGAAIMLDGPEIADEAPEDTAKCPECGAMGTAGQKCAACGAMIPMPAVTAAGGPAKPPRAWFFEAPPEPGDERLVPQYDVDTGEYLGDAVPLTIIDGRMYGHLAPANRCHIGIGECVTINDTDMDFSHFHLGAVTCDDGTQVATGSLSVGCDHAPLAGLTTQQARDHYANHGLAWADVTVVASPLGPWVCGAVRPDVTEGLLRAVQGGGISGDWRGYNLSLIAILAVPTPGFTIQRVRPLAASAHEIDIIDVQAGAMLSSVSDWAIVTAPIRREALTASAHANDGSCCSPCLRTALAASGASTIELALYDQQVKILERLDVHARDLGVLKLRTQPMLAEAYEQIVAQLKTTSRL